MMMVQQITCYVLKRVMPLFMLSLVTPLSGMEVPKGYECYQHRRLINEIAMCQTTEVHGSASIDSLYGPSTVKKYTYQSILNTLVHCKTVQWGNDVGSTCANLETNSNPQLKFDEFKARFLEQSPDIVRCK
jgi:hypothetical protein